MKNYIGGLLAALLVVALVSLPLRRESVAQDTWTGRSQSVTTFSGSVASPAAVISAISGKKIVVKSIAISAGSASTITFTDGSGGTTLFNVYVPATSTPVILTEAHLGPGFSTTAGTALYASGVGTIQASFRIQQN